MKAKPVVVKHSIIVEDASQLRSLLKSAGVGLTDDAVLTVMIENEDNAEPLSSINRLVIQWRTEQTK